MVAAAVAATIDSTRIHAVDGMGFAKGVGEPTFSTVAELIAKATNALPEPSNGPIVAEHGEFYEEPALRVEGHIGREFKYVESIAERETVAVAHHAAYAARNLLL